MKCLQEEGHVSSIALPPNEPEVHPSEVSKESTSKESPTPYDPKGIGNKNAAADVSKNTSSMIPRKGIFRAAKRNFRGRFKFNNLPSVLRSYVLNDKGLIRDIRRIFSGK